MTQYAPHAAANAFPMLTGDALAAITADIKANGLKHPAVLLWEGAGKVGSLLDGRVRQHACGVAGVALEVEYVDTDPWAYVVSVNLHRRHLNESQRALVAERLAMFRPGRPGKTRQRAGLRQGEAAHLLNVGERTVQRARHVVKQGARELVQAVEDGDLDIGAAAELAQLPKAKQREILAAAADKNGNLRAIARTENRSAKASSIAIPLGETDVVALNALAAAGDVARDPRARAGAGVLRRVVPALRARA